MFISLLQMLTTFFNTDCCGGSIFSRQSFLKFNNVVHNKLDKWNATSAKPTPNYEREREREKK